MPTAAPLLDLNSIAALPQRSIAQAEARRNARRERRRHQLDPSLSSREVSDPHDDETGQRIDSAMLERKEQSLTDGASDSKTDARQRSDSPSLSPMPKQYECLDHTADVQFHSWGDSLEEAMAQMLLCITAFMIDGSHTAVKPAVRRTIKCSAPSLSSLLYELMNEALFLFNGSDDSLALSWCSIASVRQLDHSWTAEGEVRGERYDKSRHGHGTEIKAITYSNMQIFKNGHKVNLDSDSDGSGVSEDCGDADVSTSKRPTHAADIFVIVDI